MKFSIAIAVLSLSLKRVKAAAPDTVNWGGTFTGAVAWKLDGKAPAASALTAGLLPAGTTWVEDSAAPDCAADAETVTPQACLYCCVTDATGNGGEAQLPQGTAAQDLISPVRLGAAADASNTLRGILWKDDTTAANRECTCITHASINILGIGTEGSDSNLYLYTTDVPTQMPSSQPSEAPSSQPSSQPSEMPSSQPSEAPSSQPSSQPSESPSSQPSEAPSSQPSEHPSESPSCTPSSSPTDPSTTFQYYADWSPGENGCKNDGNEPNYMSANPSNYLYSTLDKCCTTHFGWNYLACMGQLDNVCARSLWYPDWSGADKGCLDDGNEPAYMTDNPTYYMYANKIDCCEQHYNWMYTECVGAKTSANSGLYYPDFDSSDHVCRNDGLQPMYMEQSPQWWMHKDLKSCCTTNYSWNYEECVKSDPNAAPVPNPDVDGKYFPDWLGSEQICKNDGTQPPYMTKNPDMWMYDTLDACCKARYAWKYDACRGQSSSSGTGSGVWFKNDAGNCVESDTGNGVHDEWDTTYTTKKKCCAGALWWDDDCEDR